MASLGFLAAWWFEGAIRLFFFFFFLNEASLLPEQVFQETGRRSYRALKA